MFYHVWYKFPNEFFVVIPVMGWPVSAKVPERACLLIGHGMSMVFSAILYAGQPGIFYEHEEVMP